MAGELRPWLVAHTLSVLLRVKEAYDKETRLLAWSGALPVSAEDSGGSNPEQDGHQNLRLMKQYLDCGPWKRSPLQTKFHTMCLRAVIPLLYGDSWAQHSREVLFEQNMKFEEPLVYCSMPRRFGKSVAVATFVSALLLTRGCTVAIYSMSGRAADALLKEIKAVLLAMARKVGASPIILTNSKTELTFLLNDRERICKSLPSRNVRGQGADVIVCDEMAFMSEDLLLEGIFPQVERSKTVLLSISSPSPTTLYRLMKELQCPIPGQPGKTRSVFSVLDVQMACPRCIQSGSPQDCTHREQLRPKWKDRSRSQLMQRIYQSANRNDTFSAESLGIPTMARFQCFSPTLLNPLFHQFDRPSISDIAKDTKLVVISSDISGGSHSATTFVAWAMHSRQFDDHKGMKKSWIFTLVGVHSTTAVGSQIDESMRAYIRKLKSKFKSALTRFLFAPEGSIISFCCGLAEVATQEGLDTVYHETNSKITNPGIRPSAQSKDNWVKVCFQTLALHSLRIARDFVVIMETGCDYNSRDELRKNQEEELHSQLTLMRSFPRGNGLPPFVSGKADSMGKSTSNLMRDDVAVGFMLAAYTCAKLKDNPRSLLYGSFVSRVAHSQRIEGELVPSWTFMPTENQLSGL